MARLTFYRKYRSNTFSEIIGQQHVVQTLSNAIRNKRLSHAYIFSGPRGTGKTSIARIFAKAVNVYEEENQFESLDTLTSQRISKGICVDIVEIDAASNTGVDNIRDLNNKVHFTPVECSYKFYIIDEAHMLSTGAFNALLKTVEEPPSHTIFILATTEPHKIPITIHSRCQHLRFRNLSDSEISSHLRYVCEKEAISIDDESLAILSRNASGCMRDGLSLLDQMYSFKGHSISIQDVTSILGTCDLNAINTLISSILSLNSDAVLAQLDTLLQAGINPLQLLKDMTYITEQLLAFQSNCHQLVTHNLDAITKMANHHPIESTIRLLDCLAHVESETRWFSNPGLLLRIRFINLARASHSPSASSTSQASSSTPRVTSSLHSTSVNSSPSASSDHSTTAPFTPLQSQPTPPQTPSPPTTKTISNQPSPVPPTSSKTPHSPPSSKNISPPPSSPHTNTHSDPVLTLEAIQSKWIPCLEHIKKSHGGLFTILRQSTVCHLEKNTLTIQLVSPVQFFVEKLYESEYKQALEQLLSSYYNQPLLFTIQDMKQAATFLEVSQPNPSPSKESPQAPSTPTDTPSASPSSQSNSSSSEVSLNDVISLFEASIIS